MADSAAPEAVPAAPGLLAALFESKRPLAAVLTFAALALVPVLGLVASAREGWDAWATPAAALAAAALVPAAGVLLGRPWGLGSAGGLCWVGLVLVVLRAMTLGFTPLRIAPAVLYVGLLSLLSSTTRRQPSGGVKEPASELPIASWARENLEAIIVAFIMALVIRCFGIEVFKIPSSSMEPTLLGDVTIDEDRRLYHGRRCDFEPYHRVSRTSSGDRIMVTKFFYAAADVERYDVVVFKFPLNQSRNFIKRVVGLPDEEFKLFHGNVFTRRRGEKEFRIARRPLRTQESLWIDPADVPSFLDRWEDFERNWEVVDGPKPVVVGGELAYDAAPPGEGASLRYKPAFQDPEGQRVSDLRIAFDLTLTGTQGEISAEIQNAYGRFELRLSAAEDAALRHYRILEPRAQPAASAAAPVRLEIDRRMAVELGVYDGLAYAKVDGVLVRLEFIETREGMPPLLSGEPTVRFGGKGGTFRVRRLQVGRDVHYKEGGRTSRFREDDALTIRPGHYVVMGDNVTSSHDSRGWIRQAYKLKGSEELVEYESQQEFEKDVTAESIQDRYGLPAPPNKMVADKYGRIWALYFEDPGPLPRHATAGVIEKTIEDAPFYEIGERYIVGKALWVWWPPGRWFHLIR